jgi:hypothetical protein
MSDDFEKFVAVANNLESKLESHIQSTNDKLDILIDITRQLTILQERQSNNTSEIQRLERLITSTSDKTAVLIDKINDKIASVEDNRVKSIERIATKAETTELNLEKLIQDTSKELKVSIEKISLNSISIEKEFVARYNYSKGAYKIIGCILVIIQLIFVGVIIKITSDKIDQNNISIQQLQNKIPR